LHDIKYFFSIKIIRQFRRGKKNFQKRQIIEKINFQNSREQLPPLDPLGSEPVYKEHTNAQQHNIITTTTTKPLIPNKLGRLH
jgi:hypothetical protein